MRPFSHRTNYQRVVISSANDFFFFTNQNFLNCFPGLQFYVRWQNPLFLDSYPSSGHLISGAWPIEVPLIETFLVIRKIAYLRCEQEGVKWVITKLSPFYFCLFVLVLFLFFFFFLANAKLSLLLQCKQGQMRHECRLRCFEFIQNLVCRIMW